MRKIAFIVFLFFCLACNKGNNAVTPAITTRTLQGTVHLYDEFGHRQPYSYDVNVYINGTSGATYNSSTATYITPSNDTTTSDSTGSYILYDITQATYTLTYSKTGYGTVKLFNYHLIGSAASVSLSQVSLLAQSTTKPASLTISPGSTFSTDTILIGGTVDTTAVTGNTRGLAVFIGTDGSVDSTHYSYYINTDVKPGTNTFSTSFYPSIREVASGTKLYFIVYGQPSGPATSYTDPSTDLTVHPGLNPTPSQVQSIVVQ